MVAGLILAGLALGGWLASMRRRRGVAEYFFALSAGLILLWPVQWSGDRFALPLLPLLLRYATDALASLGRKLTRRAPVPEEDAWSGRFLPTRGALPARRILAAAAVVAVLSWVEVARCAPSGPVRLENCPGWADRQHIPPRAVLLSMTVPLLDR